MHFALITLLAVAGALAQPSVPNLPKINPDAPLAYVDWSAVVASPSAPLTNAKRFEQGLSPLKPKMKRHRGGPHGGTRVRSAPRAQISPAPPISVSCKLFATLADGTPKGYVVPEWNDFGEYYKFQPAQEGALSVSFSYSPDAPSEIALTATNGPHKESFPFFGGVLGYATSTVDYAFGPGSYNYAYLAGTTQTEPGAPPTDGPNSFTTTSGYDRKIESSIWTYNPATTELSAQWVNADLTTPTTYITYTQGVMTLNGDPNAAANTFGTSEILKLKCVPPVTVVPV